MNPTFTQRIVRIWNQWAGGGRYDESKNGQWAPYPSNAASGIYIGKPQALTVSDYFKCVNLGSRTIASLPWKVFEPAPLGKTELPDHYLYNVLHKWPNDLMTSFTYRVVMMRHVLCWGNHWSVVERQGYSGRTVALWPLLPESYDGWEQDAAGEMWWKFRSRRTGQLARYRFSEVLHIAWLPHDGIVGCTPIDLEMDAIGAAKATELYGARFFGNNSRPDGFLSTASALSKEARERLKKSWQEAHSGDNQHRLAVLEEGLTFQTMSISNDHAQFLETRKYQRADICGWFPIPLHLIGDLDRATNNNIEQQTLDYSMQFVSPWAECIEQECNRKLFMPREVGTLYTKLIMKGLLRGDTAARTAHYIAMRNSGVYTANEILAMEDMNGYIGGDEHMIQLSYTTVENAAKGVTQSAQPAGSPEWRPAIKEMTARIRRAYTHIFRDLIGRILQRKPENRARYAAEAAILPLLALYECIHSEISEESETFLRDYAGAFGLRSREFTRENLAAIVETELARATAAIMERGIA